MLLSWVVGGLLVVFGTGLGRSSEASYIPP